MNKNTKAIKSTNTIITNVMALIVQVGVVLAICILLVITYFIYPWSESFASYRPVVAYMQLPVIILSYLIIFTLLCSFGLVFWTILRVQRNAFFSANTIVKLRFIGYLHFSVLVTTALLIGYAQIEQPGGVMTMLITLFCVFGMMLSFFTGMAFHLVANLVARANIFKEENDLTV